MLSSSVSAQESRIDSIEARLPELKNDSLKVKAHIELSRLYYGSSLGSAMQHAQAAYEISKNKDLIWGIADAENWIANVYSVLSDYNKAMDLYLSSLEKRKKINDIEGISGSYNNIAVLYSDYFNYDKAIEYLLKALALSKSLNDEYGMAINLNNLMVMYLELGEPDKAIPYGMKCLALNQKLGNRSGIADAYNNLGDLYSMKGEYDKVEEYQKMSLNIYRQLNNLTGELIARTSIAELHMHEKKYIKAEKELKKALEIASSMEAKLQLASIHKIMADMYEKKNDYKAALYHFISFGNIQDSIFREDNANAVFEKQVILDTEYQLKEIELLEKDKALKKIEFSKQKLLGFFIIMIAGILFIIIIIASLVIQERDRNAALIHAKNTELYYSNKQIEKSQKELLKLNNSRNKFYSIISHDLLNPFSSFIDLSEILYNNSSELSESDIKKYSSSIHSAARNLFHLVKNLLDWSQSQVGKIHNDPGYLNLYEFTEGIIELLKDQAVAKKLNIVNEVPKTYIVFADRNILTVIMRNLLSNAIKYTKSGGDISIEAREEGPHIKLEVNDTGVGIKNKDIRKLLSLNESISTPGTAGEKGTGLGLIICKEFAKRMGGKLQIKSRTGLGSSFSFSITTIPMKLKK